MNDPPLTISKLNKLAPDISSIDSYSLSWKNLLSFIRSVENSSFSICNPLEIKLLDKFLLRFSHLHELSIKTYRISSNKRRTSNKHRPLRNTVLNFSDTTNLLRSYSLEIESTRNYYLQATKITSPFVKCIWMN